MKSKRDRTGSVDGETWKNKETMEQNRKEYNKK
jgi:hypothetical protein